MFSGRRQIFGLFLKERKLFDNFHITSVLSADAGGDVYFYISLGKLTLCPFKSVLTMLNKQIIGSHDAFSTFSTVSLTFKQLQFLFSKNL